MYAEEKNKRYDFLNLHFRGKDEKRYNWWSEIISPYEFINILLIEKELTGN